MATFSIFGAGGWIGSALVRHLGARGHELRAITRESWPAAGERLGHAVYAIGLTADFRNNPLPTAQAHVAVLLRALEQFKYDSFLYLSTTRVYRHVPEAHEDAALWVRPTDPDDIYNLTKLAGESVCLSLPSPKIRVARLSNVIGAGDRSKNFLPSVMDEARRTRAVVIRTSPDSEKDYIALEDVVALAELIALNGRHRLYNVAAGRNVSNRLIADLIREHMGATVSFAADAAKVIFPPIVVDRIRDEFDVGRTPFETAFSRLLDEEMKLSIP
jgi:nucleoside-diphosphate-sugar epimerase